MTSPEYELAPPSRAADGWPLARVLAAAIGALGAVTFAIALAAPGAWARTTERESGRGGVWATRSPKASGERHLAGSARVRGARSSARAPERTGARSPAIPYSDTSVTLYLLGTTDVHGHLYPYDYYTGRPGPGLALLAPLIDSVRATHPGATYLFDSGDLLQGTPLTLLAARPAEGTRGSAPSGPGASATGAPEKAAAPPEPNPVIRAMNLLGYTASAVGNHEYNYGIPALDRALADAHFPFVSANVFLHGTDRPAYRPYALVPHVVSPGDTILIGVTGITPPGVVIWDRANVAGKLDFRDPVASLRPVVAEMKARGADVVVVLNHGGLAGSSYDTATVPAENQGARIAREVPGIDVVFLGHTHRELADSAIGGVLLTQAGAWARSLADAELTLVRRGPSDWSVTGKHATLLRPDPRRASQMLLDSLRSAHERAVAYVGSVIGRAAQEMDAAHARTEDTPLVDFINEVQRRTAGAQLSATAAFSLGARVPAGPVTIGEIAALYPYENTLSAVRITGAQLKAYLEKSAEYFHAWPTAPGESLVDFQVPGYNFDVVSGVDYVIDLSKPAGQRITGLSYRGQPVRPAETFTMALNNYRQGGGGGFAMVAGAPATYASDRDIRDLLVDEVRRRGTLRPGDYFHRNWRIVPAAAQREAERELAPGARRAAAAAPAAPPAPVARAAPVAPAAPSPGPKRLRVLTTNDLHGHLLPETYGWSRGRPVGGAATLAAYFRAERDSFPGPTIVLDAGDEMQGTPISNLSEGQATVSVLDALGERGAAIGNHEFDWGVPVLRRRMAQAHDPWMAANIFVAGTDTAPSWVRDTAMVEVGGVRVGLLGLATESTPSTTKADNVAGLEFRDGAAAIDRWVPVLRRAGADFVVVLAHSGAFCDSTGTTGCRGEVVDWAARARERPDLIVAGHTHTLMRTVVNGIPIVQAASYGTHFGVVDLRQATTAPSAAGTPSGEPAVTAHIRDVPIAWADAVRPDSAVAALVARWQARVGPRVAAVVATLATPLPRRSGDYALGRLLADAWRAETGAQVAFMNNGGIRTALPAGPVTWGKLFELQPFQNRLSVITITGARLRQALETAVRGRDPDANVSGIRATYDPSRPAGQRLVTLALASGEPVIDSATYTVAMPDFLAGGGDRFSAFAQPVARRDTRFVDLDALIDYLRKRPQPVRAPQDARLIPVGPGPDGGVR